MFKISSYRGGGERNDGGVISEGRERAPMESLQEEKGKEGETKMERKRGKQGAHSNNGHKRVGQPFHYMLGGN